MITKSYMVLSQQYVLVVRTNVSDQNKNQKIRCFNKFAILELNLLEYFPSN